MKVHTNIDGSHICFYCHEVVIFDNHGDPMHLINHSHICPPSPLWICKECRLDIQWYVDQWVHLEISESPHPIIQVRNPMNPIGHLQPMTNQPLGHAWAVTSNEWGFESVHLDKAEAELEASRIAGLMAYRYVSVDVVRLVPEQIH